MGDEEYELAGGNNNSGGGNWWASSSTRSSSGRLESGATPSSTTTAASISFGWPTEIVDMNNNKAARPCMESLSLSSTSHNLFFPLDSHHDKLPPPHESSSGAGGGGGLLTDPNLQIMGLGLSSQPMDWNQAAVFRDEKAESSSFRSMLQEGMSSNANCQQESGATSTQDHHHWRQKLYSSAATSDDSSVDNYKQQMNHRGFSLDHQQQPTYDSGGAAAVTCQGLATSSNFQLDPSYGNHQAAMLQGLLVENQAAVAAQQSSAMNMNYQYQASYTSMNSGELMPNWSKFPQFLNNNNNGSPPKQQQQPHGGQLHFSNSTPFWNATASAAAVNDVRSTFFPSLHNNQLPTPIFEDKLKQNTTEVRELGSSTVVMKKTSSSGSETSNKRPRNESSSPLPAFKVRKEKMGDRITALQQLVSPFGKTDTASVLSEAIEYIKFLHEQVNVLSTPYMKSGGSVQHPQQQHFEKTKDQEGPKQDLRSRGLCLVPVSSTFPVTHETTVDFWTPTFGGTFR